MNINWFDIIDPAITEYELGKAASLTYDPAIHLLTNRSGVVDWDPSSVHLSLQDGSDLSDLDFTQFGITSWTTTDFDNAAVVTTWDGANLSGITLHSDGNFGAGDSFTGADFSNVVWGTATSTADPAKFFSGGSGATSAATAADAINFIGADLSLITGTARTTMINNLGAFDGGTPIGPIIDPEFIANSGWDLATLTAAGWQYGSSLLAYWPLDVVNNNITPDMSGNGHDGTVVNASGIPGRLNDARERPFRPFSAEQLEMFYRGW